MTPRRVLVISYLPPTPGGIATWAEVLRRGASNGRYRFLFESVGGARSGDGRPLSLKVLVAAGLVVRLIRRLARSRPELVHLNSCMSPLGVWRDLFLAMIVRAWRVPLLVHYRGSLPDVLDRLPTSSRIALRGLMNFADINVGVTRESESLLRRSCGERAVYLPNFVDDQHFPLSPAEPSREGRERRRVRAAYVGRLSTDKGTRELLEAARRIPNVDFVLMGEISRTFRHAVEAAPANVIATGALPRAEVMASLRDADLFVFPSRREGFPNAVLEAMAAALPIVATRVGAIPEMVEEGRGGYLVAPSDPKALAVAIERVLVDRTLLRQMGEHNRKDCLQRFGFDTVFARLIAIYEHVVSPTRDRETEPLPFRPLLGPVPVGAQRREDADS
jgi:glycosyltransferase involved in cell wall biosynthesis